jgi:phage shock protein PspC (stress-responsive transcriptional regulator)
MRERLYRSRRFRIFGGVAGGLAQYFNLDPVLIRVLFVIITVLHGFGILLYIILWIVVPEEPFELAYQVKPDANSTDGSTTENAEPFIAEPIKSKNTGRIIAGIILIGIGLIFFADKIIPSFDLGDVFPIAIILVGAALIWNSMKK